VHARGNLALDEKNRLIGEVEKRVLAFDGLKTVYTRIGEQPRGMSELTEDTIGVIQFEFADWRSRPPAHEIMDAIRDKTADIPGILIEVTAPRAGPPTGKPIQVQIGATDPAVLPAAARKVAAILATRDEIRDLDDGQPLPGIDWKIERDEAEARKHAARGISRRQPGAPRHKRPEGDEIPAGGHRQVGQYPGPVPVRPPQPRPDRRPAGADPNGARADRQLRAAGAGAARRLH